MLRYLYNVLLHLALPFLPLRLWWRGRKEPSYRRAILQRCALYGDKRAPGKLIWLHAVSLGETRAAAPLLRALRMRYPEYRLLVTQMTATGRAAALEMYGDFAEIAWLPYDYPWAMRRFVARYTPAACLVMETELWPNLLVQCRRFGVPVMLVNARLSERSARGYARLGQFGRKLFARLAAVGAQGEEDAARLRRLGAQRVHVTGNLKFDMASDESQAQLAKAFRSRFGSRKVFLLASTRDGEEELILDALASASLSNALIVIVPRHPQRFEEVAAILSKRGLAFVRRSDERDVPSDCGFLLGDSLGEMAAYYAACDLAFIGGSLLPYGAQNLIEACAAGAPVLIGPSTFNFAQAAAWAAEAGAAIRIAGVAELAQQAGRLLNDQNALLAMREAGLRFAAAHRGATARTMALIEPLLP